MDYSACVDQVQTAIHELTQGQQMAELLRLNLHSPEARNFLIRNILSSHEKALLVLTSGVSKGQPRAPSTVHQVQNVISKKRKGSTAWEDQVRVCSGNELEDNTDDGYNWRKYGQKDISGAKFPRSYYKCSYRKVQKCLATKQVQRTDEDPTVFDIAYKGKHTCNLGARSLSPPPPPTPPPPPPTPPPPPRPEKHENTPTHQRRQLSPPNPGEMLSNLKASLSVDTLDLSGDTVPSSFSIPSTSSGLMKDCHQLQFPTYYDDGLWQPYSSSFISPATSESNFFVELGPPPSLDFLPDPIDLDPNFEELCNSLF